MKCHQISVVWYFICLLILNKIHKKVTSTSKSPFFLFLFFFLANKYHICITFNKYFIHSHINTNTHTHTHTYHIFIIITYFYFHLWLSFYLYFRYVFMNSIYARWVYRHIFFSFMPRSRKFTDKQIYNKNLRYLSINCFLLFFLLLFSFCIFLLIHDYCFGFSLMY